MRYFRYKVVLKNGVVLKGGTVADEDCDVDLAIDLEAPFKGKTEGKLRLGNMHIRLSDVSVVELKKYSKFISWFLV